MRDTVRALLPEVVRLGREIQKSAPAGLAGQQWTGSSYVDSWKRTRQPTPNELLGELKGVAWACISLNAATCASYPPSLYVVTEHNRPRPKCPTRPVFREKAGRLRARPELALRLKKASIIEEVTDHPILDLLRAPNPHLSLFDLWELTQVYLEVHGRAYWYLERGLFGVERVWILPAQNVVPKRGADSPNMVDYYAYRAGREEVKYDPADVIAFSFPDPKDPYNGGLSPLRACYEQVLVLSEYNATKGALFENRGIPSALVSPDEVIGEEERDRLEVQWNQRFRRGGAGRVVVAESGLKVNLLQQSMGDLAALAEMGATKELVSNAFHIPVAYWTSNTNLANLVACNTQYMDQAIEPRLQRRDERLNAQLVPLYDPTGRLFLASEDPVPSDSGAMIAQQDLDLRYGVISINEMRAGRGLPPVPWGEVPWLSTRMAPTDVPRAMPGADTSPHSDDYGSPPSGAVTNQ